MAPQSSNVRRGPRMRTYVFAVRLDREPDGRWTVTCPMLPSCATWGATKEIALRNIQELVQAYVSDAVEAGDPVPSGVAELDEPAVSVTLQIRTRANGSQPRPPVGV